MGETAPFHYNIDSVKAVTLLTLVKNVSCINFPTYYIGGGFTILPFHDEDGVLPYIFYFTSRVPKVGKLLQLHQRSNLRNLSEIRYLLQSLSTTMKEICVRSSESKNIFFNANMLFITLPTVKVSILVQKANQFVISERSQYFESVNKEYNFAMRTNFEVLSCPEVRSHARKTQRLERPLMVFTCRITNLL